MNEKRKKRNLVLAKLSLFFCLFFNPCGYDAIFKMVLDMTGDYWNTVRIFYLVAASFLGLHFYFLRINPIRAVCVGLVDFINKLKNFTIKK